jgi:hypothetical protein
MVDGSTVVPEDLAGHGAGDSPQIHLERLDPSTGEELENRRLKWKANDV